MIKIWLDDEREAPGEWIRVYTAQACISTLDAFKNCGDRIDHLSLDHDLGSDAGTGYDVLLWIEEKVFNDSYVPPETISVHSANAGARKKMLLAVDAIKKHYDRLNFV